MAIKKGAFELYTQERKLPEKKEKNSVKSSHFFDDVYINKNGSRTVHERFMENGLAQIGSLKDHEEKALNGDKDNGSQSVHDRLTGNESAQIECPLNPAETVLKGNEINGSQSEHNRFTSDNANQLNSLLNQVNSALKNSSQTVHDNHIINKSTQINNLLSRINDLINSGSQSVHNEWISLNSNAAETHICELEQIPKITFSKLVGNQREIIIALYKNMKINKSDITDELTLESISKLTGVNQKSLKNTLFRLNNAGVLIRADQKVGRGGWVKYKINSNIIREIQQKEFLR